MNPALRSHRKCDMGMCGANCGVIFSSIQVSLWAYKLSQSGDHICFPCCAGCPQDCHNRDAYPTKMLLPARLAPTNVTDHLTSSQLPVPRDTSQYLELNYGKNFMTPIKHGTAGSKGTPN